MATPYLDELSKREIPFAESMGGPLLIVPRSTAGQWWGCNDADGEYAYGGDVLTDYDRATDAGEFPTLLETREGSWALVLEMPDPGTLWKVDADTALVVQWVGAETEAGLVSAALGVADEEWEKTEVVIDVPAGGLAIFDSGEDGRTPPDEMENGCATLDELEGRFAIDRIVDLKVTVNGGPSGSEDVMAQLLRLRRLT